MPAILATQARRHPNDFPLGVRQVGRRAAKPLRGEDTGCVMREGEAVDVKGKGEWRGGQDVRRVDR